VKFHPNGQSIVSVSEDSTVRFWNLEGSLLATLRGHNQGINSVSFSPDGQIVASAGNDGIVILWSLNLNQLTTRACHWVDHYLQTNPTGQLTSHICNI
jgi:WD40 repeat protein